ncbi:hypothetical protein niasHT_006048 [Heterodera trifolii]|uniref:N-acetyltransferase domain-containing protein n=1 Tax=Heterodera trifolii TaxID=157864 RepID=A0ABD2M0V7_9BILA
MSSNADERSDEVFATFTINDHHHKEAKEQLQIDIRRMRAEEVQACAEIIRDAYLDDCRKIEHATAEDRMRMHNTEPARSVQAIRNCMDEPESVLFVAENKTKTADDGSANVIAFCRLKLCQNGSTINGGPFAEIGPFATLIGFQGFGIGTALLNEAHKYAQRQWHVAEMQLEVHGVKRPNGQGEIGPMTAQMHFYAKRGYRRTGKVRWFNKPSDANFVVVPSHLAYLELMVKTFQ